MKQKNKNWYNDLKIDIPTVHGVLIEKFKEPVIDDYGRIRWYDKNDLLHSFNGFPCCIEVRKIERECFLVWNNHGVYIKSLILKMKLESEIIAEKIKARNFQRRAKAKKK